MGELQGGAAREDLGGWFPVGSVEHRPGPFPCCGSSEHAARLLHIHHCLEDTLSRLLPKAPGGARLPSHVGSSRGFYTRGSPRAPSSVGEVVEDLDFCAGCRESEVEEPTLTPTDPVRTLAGRHWQHITSNPRYTRMVPVVRIGTVYCIYYALSIPFYICVYSY